jgi:polysaccharide export outer membrane protein
MTKIRLLLPLLLAIPIAGVAQKSNPQTASNRPSEIAAADSVEHFPLRNPSDRTFRVGPGDVLNLSVWDEPQLSTKALVRPDGLISMPLIGEVAVDGLTTEQIQTVLTDRLTKVLKHPRVYVVVEEIHSRVVYITGEVEHPGAYPLVENINVMQLIARSGGLTEYAHKHGIVVLRQGGGQKLKLDYDRVLKGRDPEQNVALAPGDMVVIP